MKKNTVLKLIGLTVLTMVTLVGISFIEVAVYSYLINPNQSVAVYEQHANFSAPIVATIGGFVIFFLVTRFWKKKNISNITKLVFLFPLTYLIIDIVILLIAGYADWKNYIGIFVLASGAKFLGSFLGYKIG